MEEKYFSRRYLREKWEGLKWDIENVLRIYDEGEDRIPAKNVRLVKNEVRYFAEALLKELEK